MMIEGTSHFTSLQYAIEYYAEYGYTEDDVWRKIRRGEIHLGPPEKKDGHTLTTIDDGKRYAYVSGTRKRGR